MKQESPPTVSQSHLNSKESAKKRFASYMRLRIGSDREPSPEPPPRFNRGESPLLIRRNVGEQASPFFPRRWISKFIQVLIKLIKLIKKKKNKKKTLQNLIKQPLITGIYHHHRQFHRLVVCQKVVLFQEVHNISILVCYIIHQSLNADPSNRLHSKAFLVGNSRHCHTYVHAFFSVN